MPVEDIYSPPINIRVRDNRAFGRKPLVGIHSVKQLGAFKCKLRSSLNLDESEVDGTELFFCFPIPSVASVVTILTSARKSVVSKDKTNKIFSFVIKFRNKCDFVFLRCPCCLMIQHLPISHTCSRCLETQYLNT